MRFMAAAGFAVGDSAKHLFAVSKIESRLTFVDCHHNVIDGCHQYSYLALIRPSVFSVETLYSQALENT